MLHHKMAPLRIPRKTCRSRSFHWGFGTHNIVRLGSAVSDQQHGTTITRSPHKNWAATSPHSLVVHLQKLREFSKDVLHCIAAQPTNILVISASQLHFKHGVSLFETNHVSKGHLCCEALMPCSTTATSSLLSDCVAGPLYIPTHDLVQNHMPRKETTQHSHLKHSA